MPKIYFTPPLQVATYPVYNQLTEIEFDPINKTCHIGFYLDDNKTNEKQNEEKIKVERQNKINAMTTTIGKLRDRVSAKYSLPTFTFTLPNLLIIDLSKFLFPLVNPLDHQRINKKFAILTGAATAPAIKPEKGKSSTLLTIAALFEQPTSNPITSAWKNKKNTEYILKKALFALFEAFNGELCRLIMTPSYAPKVRSLHNPDDNEEIGVLSKKIKNWVSARDLNNAYKIILTADQLIDLGAARLSVYAYAAEEYDLNKTNYGINKQPTKDGKLQPGTHFMRIDPGMAAVSIMNAVRKIYGLPEWGEQKSAAFCRKVQPNYAFPLHPQDINELPLLTYATPYHSLFDLSDPIENNSVKSLVQHAKFITEKFQHFLKIAVIERSMLESIGKAMISNSQILINKYGEEKVKEIDPSFIDTEDFKKNANDQEYVKAFMCAICVNHYVERFKDIRNMLLDMIEFREALFTNAEKYFSAIVAEFQEFNNDFHDQVKHQHRLVNLGNVQDDLKNILSEAQDKHHHFCIQKLKKYIKMHPWKVGFQFWNKCIVGMNGKSKKVPTHVFHQMEVIKEYEKNPQNPATTLAHLLDIGYDGFLNSKSDDVKDYYACFKNRHIASVLAFIENKNSHDCNNSVPSHIPVPSLW